jgi:hypothetical protein
VPHKLSLLSSTFRSAKQKRKIHSLNGASFGELDIRGGITMALVFFVLGMPLTNLSCTHPFIISGLLRLILPGFAAATLFRFLPIALSSGLW